MTTVESEQESLTSLAAAYGIQRSYIDVYGNVHEVPLKTVRQMLVAMGVQVGNPEQALELLANRSWTRLAQPVLIESVNRPPSEFLFQIPTHNSADGQLGKDTRVRLVVSGENGFFNTYSYIPEQLVFKKAKRVDSTTYERWGIPFPDGLSQGYYQFNLFVAWDSREYKQTISVILCPDRTYLPSALMVSGKRAGIAISLYGLRSQRNWGVGDFTDLKAFIRWAIESLHVDVIGLNPLHAISNRHPYNISPYYPSSRLYRNFIYLDIEAMEDYRSCSEARALVRADRTQELLAELRAAELVQYEQVAAVKFQVLKVVFKAFSQHHWSHNGAKTERGRQFEQYTVKEGALLDNYATFCALDVFFHEKEPDVWLWQQWPEPFQDPLSKEIRDFRQRYWEEILFYKYLQWQVETQLQETQDFACSFGACVGLYHDLATGIDPCGADSWAYRDFFVSGVTVGAPPDDFSLEGQDWGFQPPNRESYRRDGYRLFVSEIRKNCQAGGALRIDHIMRFFRLFWITVGQTAKDGTYVENYYRDLLGILALESKRANTLIIGEDLGTVAPQTRDILSEFGIFSYRVFYFERDEQGSYKEPESYPDLALAAVSTHDLPTLAAFWTEQDISLRNDLAMFPSQEQFHAALHNRREDKKQIIQRLIASGFLAKEKLNSPDMYTSLTDELHHAIIGLLLSTPAKLAILSQEDLFADTRQQNLPGSISEHPNWSTKMKFSLEQLWQDPKVEHYARVFRHWVDSSDRAVLTSP